MRKVIPSLLRRDETATAPNPPAVLRPSTVTAATRRRREVCSRSPYPALREWAAQASRVDKHEPRRRAPDGSVDSLLEAPEGVLIDLLPHWESRVSQLDDEAREDLRLVLTTRRLGASRNLTARLGHLISRLGAPPLSPSIPRTGPSPGDSTPARVLPAPPAGPGGRRLWIYGYALLSMITAILLSLTHGPAPGSGQSSFRQPPSKTVIMELGARPLPSIGPVVLRKRP